MRVDISFTKAKCRSQKPVIFRGCFNSLLQHLLRCQHQPVSLGTIGWQGSRSPGWSQRQCCAEGPGEQSTAAALQHTGSRAAQHPELLQAVSETRAAGSVEISSRIKWELHNPYRLPAIRDSYGAFQDLGQEALM